MNEKTHYFCPQCQTVASTLLFDPLVPGRKVCRRCYHDNMVSVDDAYGEWYEEHKDRNSGGQ